MKYLKTFEGSRLDRLFDFLKKKENINDKILDDLLNIDASDIKIYQSKETCKIICTKDKNVYKIIINEYSGEFGPVTNCYFLMNDESIKASKSKIFYTSIELEKKYKDFHESISKFNL